MESVRKKHEDIKLVTTEKRKIHFMWEPNYHAARCFSEKPTGNQNE